MSAALTLRAASWLVACMPYVKSEAVTANSGEPYPVAGATPTRETSAPLEWEAELERGDGGFTVTVLDTRPCLVDAEREVDEVQRITDKSLGGGGGLVVGTALLLGGMLDIAGLGLFSEDSDLSFSVPVTTAGVLLTGWGVGTIALWKAHPNEWTTAGRIEPAGQLAVPCPATPMPGTVDARFQPTPGLEPWSDQALFSDPRLGRLVGDPLEDGAVRFQLDTLPLSPESLDSEWELRLLTESGERAGLYPLQTLEGQWVQRARGEAGHLEPLPPLGDLQGTLLRGALLRADWEHWGRLHRALSDAQYRELPADVRSATNARALLEQLSAALLQAALEDAEAGIAGRQAVREPAEPAPLVTPGSGDLSALDDHDVPVDYRLNAAEDRRDRLRKGSLEALSPIEARTIIDRDAALYEERLATIVALASACGDPALYAVLREEALELPPTTWVSTRFPEDLDPSRAVAAPSSPASLPAPR
jgi:hypothetical protein